MEPMDIFSKIGQKVQTTVFPTGHVTTLPLDAQAVNDALDGLEQFGGEGRMVICDE